MKKITFPIVGMLLVFLFCFFCLKKQGKYAELREGNDGRVQILICEDIWRGLFTVHGFGGYAHNIYFLSTLEGGGPIYRDPMLLINGDTQYQHIGVIVVDIEHKMVEINLKRLVHAPDASIQRKPSFANGVYEIRAINHDPFLKW